MQVAGLVGVGFQVEQLFLAVAVEPDVFVAAVDQTDPAAAAVAGGVLQVELGAPFGFFRVAQQLEDRLTVYALRNLGAGGVEEGGQDVSDFDQ